MHYEKRIYLDHDFVCIDDTNYLQIIDGKNENHKRSENTICFKKVMNIKKVTSGSILRVNFEF